MKRKQKNPHQPKQERQWLINVFAGLLVTALAVGIFGTKPKPAAPAPPQQVAKAKAEKTDPTIGGELGKALDDAEAALKQGDKALSANEKALNAVGLTLKGSHAVTVADPKK